MLTIRKEKEQVVVSKDKMEVKGEDVKVRINKRYVVSLYTITTGDDHPLHPIKIERAIVDRDDNIIEIDVEDNVSLYTFQLCLYRSVYIHNIFIMYEGISDDDGNYIELEGCLEL